MSKELVYITREIPEKGINILSKKFKLKINDKNRNLTKDEIINNAKNAVALVTMLGDNIDSELMDSLPQLKVVANYAVGYNNIDIEAASKRAIAVTNTPDVLTETTADLSWGLILSTARRIVETDKYNRAGKYNGWAPTLLLGREVHHSKLGIIGLGRVGKAVARRAKGFGMKVFYNNRKRLGRKKERELEVEYRDLKGLLRESDFISINAPLNDSTYHLLGEEEFEIMKEKAIVINTGRGAIIDEKALVKALKEGEIAGAGLDVYENEPKVEKGLLKMDNVVLTPHIGSATYEARIKMAELAAEGLISAYEGKYIHNLVNEEVINEG